MIRSLTGSSRLLVKLAAPLSYRNGLQSYRSSILVSPSCAAVSTNSSSVQNRAAPAAQENESVEERRQQKHEADFRPPEDVKEYKVSFGKDIFLGNFDVSLLNFPEVLEKEQFETLQEMVAPIERFFEEKGKRKLNLGNQSLI